MTSLVHNISFDCADPYRLSGFWGEVLGRSRHPEDHPGDPEVALVATDGTPQVFFQQVPERKAVKNRLHVCLQPTDRSRDEEVERLLGIGATQVADHRRPDGTGWVVLADPEGNEFCVERSVAERAADGS